jgi:4-carboxymuconolactone decarboxylase
MNLTQNIPTKIQRYFDAGTMIQHDSVCVWCSASASIQRFEKLREGVIAGLAIGTPLTSIYETLLQTYLFAGFPAAIEGLSVFADTLKSGSVEFIPPSAGSYDADTYLERGLPLFAKIYGDVAGKMSKTVAAFSPDLYQWMLIEGYGKTLSRQGSPSITRELCIVAVLAVLSWQRQLFSHVRGAINVGATTEEVRHAVDICYFLAKERHADAIQTMSDALRQAH